MAELDVGDGGNDLREERLVGRVCGLLKHCTDGEKGKKERKKGKVN